MSHLIGYARVSTIDQNPQLQIAALEEAGCRRIFTDYASGTRETRPQLTECMKFLRSGDTLLVWRLDRLGRNTSHLINSIEKLNAQGIYFRSITESFDTASPLGKTIFTFLCAMAQMERDVLIERTKAGMAVARSRGRRPGPKHTLDQQAIEQIKVLVADPRLPLKDIARQYRVNRATLYRALQRDHNSLSTVAKPDL